MVEHIVCECVQMCVCVCVISIQKWLGLKCPALQSPHADTKTCTSVLHRLGCYGIVSVAHVTWRHIAALHMEP